MPFWQFIGTRQPPSTEVEPAGRFRAHRLTVLLVIVGLLGTLFGTWWSLERRARLEQSQLENQGKLLLFETEHVLDSAAVHITAAGSLFRASTHVTPAEFETFVKDVRLMPGMLGLGYVPVVADTDLDAWLAVTRREVPGLEVFELNADSEPVPLEPRDHRFPLLYFEPVELFATLQGLDLGFHDEWRDDLNQGLQADGIVMTGFIELGLPAPLDDEDQVIIGWPITDASSGIVSELAVAVVDMSMLIEANVSSEVTDGIVWQVTDVTGTPAVPFSPDDGWQGVLYFGERVWQFDVASSQSNGGLFGGTAMYPLVGGLIVTVLLAMVGQLLGARLGTRRDLATLEALNRSKDDFLAAVSHRLRTPLTSVVGFSEVLRDSETGLTEMDRRELTETIAIQAIELGHLFDNLLTVSRDSSGAPILPIRVDIATEVAAVLETAEPQRRSRVTVHESDTPAVAAGDPALIRQILRNLIANATDHGEEVEISWALSGLVVRVEVRDSGPGIPQRRIDAIFDLYDHSVDDHGQPQTMGVGLFVSRRLARQMSGDILYRRSSPWTVFEFTLPAIPVAVAFDRESPGQLETVN